MLLLPPLLQPAFSPRGLRIFNTKNGASICDLNFVAGILAVRLNRKRCVTAAAVYPLSVPH
jgi:hypothetical protein